MNRQDAKDIRRMREENEAQCTLIVFVTALYGIIRLL